MERSSDRTSCTFRCWWVDREAELNVEQRMNDSSDNQLVALALYGDAKAFELIVRRYQKLVYNVLFNMLRDHSATADARRIRS